MSTIHAIYENGVFRPITPVELPEGSKVTIEPVVGPAPRPQPSDPEFAHLDPGLARTYAILSERYNSGQPDLAERHDEHQP
jgi:hypothetical protein